MNLRLPAKIEGIDFFVIVSYKIHVAQVVKTPEFEKWFQSLRDRRAKAKILSRIDRLEDGNPGDAAPVGEGISEMRIHFGPGYRVYYKQDRDIVLLWGGDKSTQAKDIEKAKQLANP